MRRYISTIFQVLPSYFVSKEYINLPQKVGEFKLSADLSNGDRHFAVGKYKAGSKIVIIKIWSGRAKNFHYFSLLHQIKITRILTKVQKRVFKKHKTNFSIPNYVHSEVSNNKALLVTEYFSGQTLENFTSSDAKRWKIYNECREFLKLLSKECTEAEKKEITIKSVWDFIFLYPLILGAAIILQHNQVAKLVKSSVLFFRGIPELLKSEPDTIIHGDLHPGNILIRGNKRSMIDIEQTRFSYPAYELISSAALKGNSKKFKEMVLKQLVHKEDIATIRANIALIVNNSIHDLSGDKDKEGVKSYLWLLDQAVKQERI